MRILLVGEFSGLHYHLKRGLQKLGHDVILFSSGDGWKNIPYDLEISSSKENNLFKKLIGLCKDFVLVSSLKDYDVVQFINPFIFTSKVEINKYFIDKLIHNNKKSFLLAAGTDCMYWKDFRVKFKYSPHLDYKYIDNRGKELIYEKEKYYRYNVYLAEKVDGIIPISYDYDLGYRGFKNKKKVIPLPFDLETVEYEENVVKDKVVILHGISREGFKGTHFIKKALKKIEEKYKDVEIIINDRLPINAYINLLKKANIVIDQANSYSYGMNAVMAMAMGKIVLSGCEQEVLDVFGIKECPIINILPDEDDIFSKLETLLRNREILPYLGEKSRKFVESLHDAKKVAEQFIAVYLEGS